MSTYIHTFILMRFIYLKVKFFCCAFVLFEINRLEMQHKSSSKKGLTRISGFNFISHICKHTLTFNEQTKGYKRNSKQPHHRQVCDGQMNHRRRWWTDRLILHKERYNMFGVSRVCWLHLCVADPWGRVTEIAQLILILVRIFIIKF